MNARLIERVDLGINDECVRRVEYEIIRNESQWISLSNGEHPEPVNAAFTKRNFAIDLRGERNGSRELLTAEAIGE